MSIVVLDEKPTMPFAKLAGKQQGVTHAPVTRWPSATVPSMPEPTEERAEAASEEAVDPAGLARAGQEAD